MHWVWYRWVAHHAHIVELKKKAMARFTHYALWRGFSCWHDKYPPKNTADGLQRQLKREKAAHKRTKQSLEASIEERDDARAHARDTMRLQMIVREGRKYLSK